MNTADVIPKKILDKAERAVYRGSARTILSHPWLAALPELPTDERWYEQLDPEEAKPTAETLTDHELKLRIGATEEQIVPLPQSVNVAGDIRTLIDDGYWRRRIHHKGRDFAKYEDAALREEYFARVIDGIVPRRFRGQKSMAVWGMTGTGKTTTVEHALETMHPLIVHESQRVGKPLLAQVVWLKFDAPAGKSMNGLCASMLDAFDGVLGTHFAEDMQRANTLTLQRRVRDLVRDYSVGVIAIDEAHGLRGPGVDPDELMSYLLTLFNNTAVPFVFMGTAHAKKVINGVPRLARRLMPKHEWNAFACDESWSLLVDGMLSPRRLVLKFDAPVGNTAELFHGRVRGLPAALAKMLAEAQRIALDNHRRTFTWADCLEAVEALPSEIVEILDVLDKQANKVRFLSAREYAELQNDKRAAKLEIEPPGFDDIRMFR